MCTQIEGRFEVAMIAIPEGTTSLTSAVGQWAAVEDGP